MYAIVYEIFPAAQSSAFNTADGKMNVVKVLQKGNAVFAWQAEHLSHILRCQNIFLDEEIMQSVDQIIHMCLMDKHIRIDADKTSRLSQIIICLRELFLSIFSASATSVRRGGWKP